MKKNIKITMISNGERSEQNYLASKVKNNYSYQEKECKVKIEVDDTVILERENDDFLMRLVFDTKTNTVGKYILKKENIDMDLEIETDYMIIEKDMIKIHYIIKTTEQNVTFILECEENV